MKNLFFILVILFASLVLEGAEKSPAPAGPNLTTLSAELKQARKNKDNAAIHRLYKEIAALDAAKRNPTVWFRALNAEAEAQLADGNLQNAGAALRAIREIKGRKPDAWLLCLYVRKAIEKENLNEARAEAECLFAYNEFRGKNRNSLIQEILSALLRAEQRTEAIALAKKIVELDRAGVEINAMIDREKLKDAKREMLSPAVLYALEIVQANARDPKPAVIPPAPADLNAAGIDAARREAAKIFMAARDFEQAKAIGVLTPKAVPVYALAILDEAPVGVAAWRNSEIFKDAAKRETRFEKYNQKDADLLALDVNAVRNTNAAAEPDKACPVSFFAAADQYGLHLYLECADDRQDEVLAGLESGGMYEMYLVPGFGQCYYQWLVTPGPKTLVQCVAWNSRGRDYRNLDDHLKVEFTKIPGGFGLYQFISWNVVFDKLPDDRSQWPLGVIPWTRTAGGFTWGSGQVHDLHRFGRLSFQGIEKILPAIKRQIILSALGKYKKESVEFRTFWPDEVKGDPAFYQASLQPEFERLDALAKEVVPGMTPETVEKLYREAVPAWGEIAFRVSELRTKWLEKRLMDTGK